MKWKLTKYEWNEDTKSTIVGRQWFVEADRIEQDGYAIRAYREPEGLVYVSRDWDEVVLADE